MTDYLKAPRSGATEGQLFDTEAPGRNLRRHSSGGSPIDTFLAALDTKVLRRGGSYSARCPAHEDRSPSLSFREGADGRVLVKCFAGCTTLDVLRAMGLEWRDLYPSRGEMPDWVRQLKARRRA